MGRLDFRVLYYLMSLLVFTLSGWLVELGPDGRHISLANKMLGLAVVIDCRFLLYLSGMALLEEELVGQKLTEKVPHLTPSIKSAIKIIQL